MRNWVYSHNYRLAVYNCRIYFTEAAFGQPLLLFEEVRFWSQDLNSEILTRFNKI